MAGSIKKSALSPPNSDVPWRACFGLQKAQTAIDTFPQEIFSNAFGLHGWWPWVNQALNAKTDEIKLQQWVKRCLLPWVYWHQQADKTKHCELFSGYQEAASQASAEAHPLTQQLEAAARSSVGRVGTMDLFKISTHLFRGGRAQWLFIWSPSYLTWLECSNRAPCSRLKLVALRATAKSFHDRERHFRIISIMPRR